MSDKGVYLEKIVELLERSINPEAKVERNVELPIVNSKTGETTQCDIVITSGIKPRETITIVEVQNRSRKPERGQVWSWLKKLEEIDAQHLICVSKKGFPKSVKELASQCGNKLKLVHLKEINVESIPLDMLEMHFQYEDFKIDSILEQEAEIKISGIDLDVYDLDEKKINLSGIKYTDRIFSRDRSKLLSLSELCSELVPTLMKNGKGENRLLIKEANGPLYLLYEKVFLSIEIDVKFKWSKKIFEIPVNILAYEQDEYGALAWLFEGVHKRANDQIEFKLPITKVGDNYRINEMSIEAPSDVRFSIYGIKKNDNLG